MDYKIIEKANPITLEIYLNENHHSPSGIYFISLEDFSIDNLKNGLITLDLPESHIQILIKKIKFISDLINESKIILFDYIILVNKENNQNWLTIHNKQALKNKCINDFNRLNNKIYTLKSKL